MIFPYTYTGNSLEYNSEKDPYSYTVVRLPEAQKNLEREDELLVNRWQIEKVKLVAMHMIMTTQLWPYIGSSLGGIHYCAIIGIDKKNLSIQHITTPIHFTQELWKTVTKEKTTFIHLQQFFDDERRRELSQKHFYANTLTPAEIVSLTPYRYALLEPNPSLEASFQKVLQYALLKQLEEIKEKEQRVCQNNSSICTIS